MADQLLDLEPSTLEEIYARAGSRSRQAVKHHLRHLVMAGWAERVSRGVYRGTERGRIAGVLGMGLRRGPHGPRPCFVRPARATVVDRAWQALRLLGRATAAELAALIPLEPGEIGGCNPTANIRRYLKVLADCGYVRELPRDQRAGERGRAARFALARNTGPLTPIWRPSRHVLWDPNLGLEVRPTERAP